MKICIHQICYSQETFERIPEGFLTLDYRANERADWREFWPIRQFLKSNHLADDTLYGFMSPKFPVKTGLGYEDIQRFVNAHYQQQDVVSFSPFWDLGSIFKNIFEQGDFFHPGLTEACQGFADARIAGIDLRDSITHSQNNIFCNYFIAKKSFWTAWLQLADLLFEEAENGDSELALKLRNTTTYGVQRLPMKIFVQERLATICLLANKKLTCLSYNPFKMGASSTPFNQFMRESVISDALKIAFNQTQENHYLTEFSSIRSGIIDSLNKPRKSQE